MQKGATSLTEKNSPFDFLLIYNIKNRECRKELLRIGQEGVGSNPTAPLGV